MNDSFTLLILPFSGSNSVNVFLGLGLPWVLLTIYYRAALGMEYKVQSDNLTQAVILFVVVGVICLCTLLIRRFVSYHMQNILNCFIICG